MKKTYPVWNWGTGTSHQVATCTPTVRRTKTGKKIWIDVKNGNEYVLERFDNGLHFHHWAADFAN